MTLTERVLKMSTTITAVQLAEIETKRTELQTALKPLQDFAEQLARLGHMLHGIKRLAGIIKDLP